MLCSFSFLFAVVLRSIYDCILTRKAMVSLINFCIFRQLSDDAANLLRNLVNSPNSLLLGKGAFFIHVNNMIFQVLKGLYYLTSFSMTRSNLC
jgi:hypothetical protein